jgi:hypothetical protein
MIKTIFFLLLASTAVAAPHTFAGKLANSQGIVSDNFNRSDGSLGTNWTQSTGWGPLAIISNAIHPATDKTEADMYWSGAYSWTTAQFAQVTLPTLPSETAAWDCGPGTNYPASPGRTGNFCASTFIDSYNRVVVGWNNNGTLVKLIGTPVTISNGSTLKTVFDGTYINCYVDGTLVNQVAGSPLTGGVGAIGGGDADCRMDNFLAGNAPAVANTPSFPTTSILDTFTRANGSLGASWIDSSSGYTGCLISSNKVIDSGAGADICGDVWSTSFNADSHIFMEIPTVPTTEGFLIGLRLSTSNWATANGYFIQYTADGGNNLSPNGTLAFGKLVAGAPSQIGNIISLGLGAGEGLGLKVTGNTFQVYYKYSGQWGLIGTFTDSTYSAGGYIGFLLVQDSAVSIDDVGGGNN